MEVRKAPITLQPLLDEQCCMGLLLSLFVAVGYFFHHLNVIKLLSCVLCASLSLLSGEEQL